MRTEKFYLRENEQNLSNKNFKINSNRDVQSKKIIWVTSDSSKFKEAFLIHIVFTVVRVNIYLK